MLISQKFLSKPLNWHRVKLPLAIIFSVFILLAIPEAAFAHHPFGGNSPTNFIEAFLSGLGHPIIGLDHFAFVVASGLIAVQLQRGWIVPVTFVLTAMVGTGIHLSAINLPIPELIIAISVVAFGGFLTLQKGEQHQAYTILFASLAAIAGVFHGYAYGEAIVGAGMTSLVAYLIGFTFIQGAISGISYSLGRVFLREPFNLIRLTGFAISTVGIIFLSAAVRS